MNMSRSQIAWYAGFIVGTSPTYLLLEHGGVEPHLLRLGIACAVGILVGLGLSTLVKRRSM